MKSAIIASVIFLIYCDMVRSYTDEEWEKFANDCMKEEKTTDDDIKNWKNHITPKTKGVKCLNACISEKLGMVVNNKVNVDAMTKFIDTEIKDEKMASDYKTLFGACKSITDPDRCEASAKIIDCLNDEARKRGIKELF